MNCLTNKIIVEMNGLFIINQIMLVHFFYMTLFLANPINAQTISACKLKQIDKNWANATNPFINLKRFTFPYNKGSTYSVVSNSITSTINNF
jgi:hypothetical protein